MEEKFCITVQKKIIKFNTQLCYCQIYLSVLTTFQAEKIKCLLLSCIIKPRLTLLYWFLASFTHFKMVIHYKPPLVATLENIRLPNKLNVMTSFGM